MSTGGSACQPPAGQAWEGRLAAAIEQSRHSCKRLRPAMSSNVHHLYLFFDTPLQLRRVQLICQYLARQYWEQAERSEEHTSELQSPCNLVCRLLLEKKKPSETRLLPHHMLVRRPFLYMRDPRESLRASSVAPAA